jgi:anti-sigma factor RsiW
MKVNMTEADLNQLLDIASRRPLTVEEETRLQAHLAANPSVKSTWEEELALTRLLNRLPDAPLASNFTAQVLQAVEREPQQRHRSQGIFDWLDLRGPARQFTAACAAVAIAILSFLQYRNIEREKMAVAVARVASSVGRASDIAELPPIPMFEDFDAIIRLPVNRPQADEELLAGLTKN